MLLGRPRSADVGESASPQLAGDAGAGYPRRFDSAGRALIGSVTGLRPTSLPATFVDCFSPVTSEWRGAGFTAGQAARLLARAEAGWGRATYGFALGRLHKIYESRAADLDASDEDARMRTGKQSGQLRVRDWITKLVASIPEPNQNGKFRCRLWLLRLSIR